MSASSQLIQDRLALAIGAGHACHAFFISGPDDALCFALTRRAAQLVCMGGEGDEDDKNALDACPDYFELSGASVKIERVREIIAELTHRPTGLFGRAIVVRQAHALSAQAQNALLKTIEEPPENTVFLLTGNVEGALPTIASRCLVMRTGLPGRDEVQERLVALGADEKEARQFAAYSGGSIARGERLFLEEGYRNLRQSALDALVLLLSGGLPASAAKALASDAEEALTFMLTFASDMLKAKLDNAEIDNFDRREEILRLAASFTIGKLTCMIDMLSRANAEIVGASGGWYYAVPAINRLFLELSEVVNK